MGGLEPGSEMQNGMPALCVCGVNLSMTTDAFAQQRIWYCLACGLGHRAASPTEGRPSRGANE